MRNSDNMRSSDLFERLIQEGGLKIKDVHIHKDTDSLVVVLSSGSVLAALLSSHPVLSNASETMLKNWSLIGSGVGIHWEDLDEDLSLKGLISEVVLRQLATPGNNLRVAV